MLMCVSFDHTVLYTNLNVSSLTCPTVRIVFFKRASSSDSAINVHLLGGFMCSGPRDQSGGSILPQRRDPANVLCFKHTNVKLQFQAVADICCEIRMKLDYTN